jgi:hypothetical protein
VVGPNIWCVPEPIVATGWHWFAFLSFLAAIPNRIGGKRRVENMAIGNTRGWYSDGSRFKD